MNSEEDISVKKGVCPWCSCEAYRMEVRGGEDSWVSWCADGHVMVSEKRAPVFEFKGEMNNE